MLSLVSIAKMSFAECSEYKIIDHGDRVEAVCVGNPLTAAEKKVIERQRLTDDKNSKIERREDKTERVIDKHSDLSIRKSEIGLTREEIALEREKERLRRDKLKTDKLEDDSDDVTKKMDTMMKPSNKKAKKK